MKRDRPIATLVAVRIEVAAPRRGRPGYRWADGFKVITPKGLEIQPWFTKREARAFCKARGWRPVVREAPRRWAALVAERDNAERKDG